MTRVRTFYGHEGVVYPTGLVPADAAPEEDVSEAEIGEIELPDNSWKVGKIDAFASEHGITFDDGANKPEKLAAIQKWADELPTAEGGDSADDAPTLSSQEG